MLRLIGLVVVVLFVLSLAHGERSGNDFGRDGLRAPTFADQLTGTLADGLRGLGDLLFGRDDGGVPDRLQALGRNLDGLSRSADGASKHALAGMVLRACPSLGLVCQPAGGSAAATDLPPRRRPAPDAP